MKLCRPSSYQEGGLLDSAQGGSRRLDGAAWSIIYTFAHIHHIHIHLIHIHQLWMRKIPTRRSNRGFGSKRNFALCDGALWRAGNLPPVRIQIQIQIQMQILLQIQIQKYLENSRYDLFCVWPDLVHDIFRDVVYRWNIMMIMIIVKIKIKTEDLCHTSPVNWWRISQCVFSTPTGIKRFSLKILT